ncbi:MAG: PAS domain S-box protein, partial [Desulfobacterales bacterium]
MQLSDAFWKMAEHLMDVVHSETGFPVLLYDHKGAIVRATDPSRIGDRHAGAVKIMQGLVDDYAVSPEEAARDPLVREGFSCPIVIDGRRAAGFGITGPLALTRPLARVAVRLIHAWIEDSEHRQQLERSERKYRSIFDHSAQGIFQATLKGRMLTANKALARMYGFSSPEALLSALTDVTRQLYVDPEDRRRLIAQLHAAGQVTNFSTRCRRRDGEIIDVSINAHFVTDPETGRGLIEGLVEDITTRRRAEAALRLSEEKYAKAFNNSPVLVVLSALDSGRYIEVNETFERVMGYDREAIVGRSSLDIGTWADPADRDRIRTAIEKDGRVRGFEARRRTRSGRILTVLYFAEVIDVGGETCMLSAALDISERKRAEDNLRLSENNLKITLDAIGDGVIVTDTDGVIMRMNPSAEKLTGWAATEGIGRPLPEVFKITHARTQEPLGNRVDAVMAGGDRMALAGHTVLAARGGREHVIADSAAPIRDADGKNLGVVLVFRDVTETYAHEQKIRERDAHLKRLSANIPGVIYQFYATPTRDYGLH